MISRTDWSVSAVTAGFLAVLISYSGPLIIFFQAAQSAGVAPDMISSWVWAVSIGAALSGIFLSVALKVPVVTAWSAPGTALLVTLFPGLSLNEAVGAYITSAAILFAIGISGSFDRLLKHVPKGIAAGMMAGILFQFGVQAFKAAGRPTPLIIMGNRQDELAWWKEQKDANGYETMSVSIAPGVSTLAFWVAQQILDGKQVPKDLVVPFLRIDQNDLEASLKTTEKGGVANVEYTQADAQKVIAGAK